MMNDNEYADAASNVNVPNEYVPVEDFDDKNYLTVGSIKPTFPYRLMHIINSNGSTIFELVQHEDGTVTSKGTDLGLAANTLFNDILKKTQDYALSYLKSR